MIEIAHGALVPGGPGVWLFVFAGALIAAAVYLLVTKGPPRSFILLALAAIPILVGSVAVPHDDHGVTVTIEAPEDGAVVVAGRAIEIRVQVAGADASVDGQGHVHVMVDGRVVSMTGAPSTSVTLDPGPHVIEAEYVAADHRPLSPRVLARADVTARAGPREAPSLPQGANP